MQRHGHRIERAIARDVRAGRNRVARLRSQQRIRPAFAKKRGLTGHADPDIARPYGALSRRKPAPGGRLRLLSFSPQQRLRRAARAPARGQITGQITGQTAWCVVQVRR